MFDSRCAHDATPTFVSHVVSHRVIGALMAALVALAILSVPAHAATARIVPTCRVDRSPGVVTRWEYRHAHRKETRHQIRCLFGTPGVQNGDGHWYHDQRWHVVIQYAGADGRAVYLGFVDAYSLGYRKPQPGDVYRMTRKSLG